MDDILPLAGGILKAVHRHYAAGDPDLRPSPVEGVEELVFRLKSVQDWSGSERGVPRLV